MPNTKYQMPNKRKMQSSPNLSFVICNLKFPRGFTLIELLIVVAILGVLTTLFVTTFPSATRRARDSRRQNDMRQYQTALEKYANRNNGSYYNSSGTINPSTACNTLLGQANCPNDPGTYTYQYNGTTSAYVLWSRLEAISPTTYFVACSNGKVGNSTTVPSSSTCPL
jgi:prepilin-type N-terminal cleavage/methylation domain-containing protein